MALAIAHRDDEAAVLDLIREVRPPFSPEAVSKEFAEVVKSYGLARVEGDHYGGEWPREQFRKHGVDYRVCDSTRSELYLALLPAVNSGRVELVDHPPASHDDVANAAAGALVLAARRAARERPSARVGSLSITSYEREGSWW